MSNLSISQLIQYIQQAGFSGQGLQNAAAVALAESGGNPQGCPNGSVDRGAFQINNCYHPEVTDTCAFDPNCAAKAAFTISNGGTDFSPWSTFTSGKYQQFISQVQGALGSSNNTPTNSPTTGGICDAWVIGGIICSQFFEQGTFVVVGLLVALVAIVMIALGQMEKA